MLNILLFGAPQIALDGRPPHGLRRKNRAVFYYVAAHEEPVSRNHLLTLLWPDHERPAAQHILRTMVHDLRKHLGQALIVEDDYLALDDAEVDVRRFKAGLAHSQPNAEALNTLLTLYRGDFLEDFSLAAAPAFDDWSAAERERYQLLAIRGLTALSRLYEQDHHYNAAIDTIERALTLDPLREELQRGAMRLQYLNGDRAGVIRRYDRLRRLLDSELGVLPMAETRQLYDAIIVDAVAVESPVEPMAKPVRLISTPTRPGSEAATLLPFTGRAAQLQALDSALIPGRLVFVDGEPGIGKTRLIEEFFAASANRSAGEQRTLILRGRAYEMEQGLPYQPVIDALRDLSGDLEWLPLLSSPPPTWMAEVSRLIPEVADQFPDFPTISPLSDESRLWESLRQFFLHLAGWQPIILFLDDLQWADNSTLGLLGYLTRRCAGAPLLLISAARPSASDTQLQSLLQALRHENRLVHLALSALASSDNLALARHYSRTHSAYLSEWLVRHAEGNPYFITELIRFARSDGLLRGDGSVDQQRMEWTPVLPPTVENLIRSRLVRLSENGRRVIEAVAVVGVVGNDYSFSLVGLALVLPESTVIDALDELLRAGLILPQDGQFGFDHSLTMEVVRQSMGVARYGLLHRRVAEALESLNTPRKDAINGLIASHFTQSGVPQRAAPYAFRAGQLAAQLAAWAEAIAFYEQALAGTEEDAERISILLALAAARFHSGAFAAATDVYRSALELARAQGDLGKLELAHMFLAQSLLPQARYREIVAIARELRRDGPPELAVCAEFNWGTGLAVESARPAEAKHHLRKARRLLIASLDAGYTPRVTLAQIAYQLGGVLSQQGEIASAVAHYREALALAEADSAALDLLRSIMVYNNLAHNLNLLGDPAAADYAQMGITVARERGSLSHLPYLLSTSGEIALSQNRYEEARALFQEGLDIAEQISLPERVAGLTANLGLVALRVGRKDEAVGYLIQALTAADAVGARHLAVRIRMWLIPLSTPEDVRRLIAETRLLAESGGYTQLLAEIDALAAAGDRAEGATP